MPVSRTHSVQEIHQWRAILPQEEVEGLVIPRLHVQHQLDVESGHSPHSVSNTCRLIKVANRGEVPRMERALKGRGSLT